MVTLVLSSLKYLVSKCHAVDGTPIHLAYLHIAADVMNINPGSIIDIVDTDDPAFLAVASRAFLFFFLGVSVVSCVIAFACDVSSVV